MLQEKVHNNSVELGEIDFCLFFLGKIPHGILQNPFWDMKTHPHLDPTGNNSLNKTRKVKLSNLQFCDQRLKNFNPVFANSISFLMTILSYIQTKQLNNQINISVQRGHKKKKADGSVSYFLEDAFAVFDNVSGSPRFVIIEEMNSFLIFI